MSFVFINLISCLITLRNKPHLQSSGDHVNALILNQLFNPVSHRGILHTASVNKLTGRVRFLSVQQFYFFFFMLFICSCSVPGLTLSTSHRGTELSELSEQSFVHSIYPITLSIVLFLSLSVFHVSQPRPNLGSLFIYLKPYITYIIQFIFNFHSKFHLLVNFTENYKEYLSNRLN